MATVVDFKNRFPEFCNVDDSRVQLFLDDAALLMGSAVRWLDFYEVAHVYYAAHFLVVAQGTDDGDSGILAPIKEQQVDDVVIKQAIGDIKPTASELLSTSYGKRYVGYRRIVFAGVYGV